MNKPEYSNSLSFEKNQKKLYKAFELEQSTINQSSERKSYQAKRIQDYILNSIKGNNLDELSTSLLDTTKISGYPAVIVNSSTKMRESSFESIKHIQQQHVGDLIKKIGLVEQKISTNLSSQNSANLSESESYVSSQNSANSSESKSGVSSQNSEATTHCESD